jgi:hypothetical protein
MDQTTLVETDEDGGQVADPVDHDDPERCHAIVTGGRQCQNGYSSNAADQEVRLCGTHADARAVSRIDEVDGEPYLELRDELAEAELRDSHAYYLATLTDDVEELWRIATGLEDVDLGGKEYGAETLAGLAATIADHPDVDPAGHPLAEHNCVAVIEEGSYGENYQCRTGAYGANLLCGVHDGSDPTTIYDREDGPDFERVEGHGAEHLVVELRDEAAIVVDTDEWLVERVAREDVVAQLDATSEFLQEESNVDEGDAGADDDKENLSGDGRDERPELLEDVAEGDALRVTVNDAYLGEDKTRFEGEVERMDLSEELFEADLTDVSGGGNTPISSERAMLFAWKEPADGWQQIHAQYQVEAEEDDDVETVDETHGIEDLEVLEAGADATSAGVATTAGDPVDDKEGLSEGAGHDVQDVDEELHRIEVYLGAGPEVAVDRLPPVQVLDTYPDERKSDSAAAAFFSDLASTVGESIRSTLDEIETGTTLGELVVDGSAWALEPRDDLTEVKEDLSDDGTGAVQNAVDETDREDRVRLREYLRQNYATDTGADELLEVFSTVEEFEAASFEEQLRAAGVQGRALTVVLDEYDGVADLQYGARSSGSLSKLDGVGRTSAHRIDKCFLKWSSLRGAPPRGWNALVEGAPEIEAGGATDGGVLDREGAREFVLEELTALLERGLSPSEALDYWATRESDDIETYSKLAQQEWADTRGVSSQAISDSVGRAQDTIKEDE